MIAKMLIQAAFVWNHRGNIIYQLQLHQDMARWLNLSVFFLAFSCTTCLCTWIFFRRHRSPPLALHSLDRSRWYFRGFGKYSGTDGMDRSSGSLMPVQTAPCYEWRMEEVAGSSPGTARSPCFACFSEIARKTDPIQWLVDNIPPGNLNVRPRDL